MIDDLHFTCLHVGLSTVTAEWLKAVILTKVLWLLGTRQRQARLSLASPIFFLPSHT